MTEIPRRHSHRNLTDTLALSWLRSDQHGASVLTTANQLLAAEQETRHVLPPGMADVCRVARIERQQITLAVPSAAYASKLRQLAPRVLLRLNDAGWNLTEVSVRVQGTLAKNVTKPPTRETEPLGSTALEAFGRLHAELPPGPLSEAIERLLKRHV